MGYRTCPNCLEHLSLTDSHALKCSLCGHDFYVRKVDPLTAIEESSQPEKRTRDQVRKMYAEKKRTMVRKLLYLGYQMGYDVARTAEEQRLQKWEVNMAHVNSWALSEKSKVRKKINEMTYQELVVSLTQFQLVFKDFKKRV